MKNLFWLSIFLVSCNKGCYPDGVKYSLYVQNNSKILQFTLYKLNYPDTSLPEYKDIMAGISPESRHIFDSKDTWDKVIATTPKDTMSVFFINKDTVDRYGWDSVRVSYKGVKRVDFNYSYLKSNNFTIQN